MTRWTPDPTFYPSPRLAQAAPPERLAYVALLDPGQTASRRARRDRPRSELVRLRHHRLYARDARRRRRAASLRLERVQRGAVPHVAPPAHRAPLPGRPRLALVAHHIVDTKPDPRQPKLVRTIEAEELAPRAATAALTRCIAVLTRSTSTRWAAPTARTRRHHAARPREVRPAGRAGRSIADRSRLAYDFWWHLGYDTLITSEWGTPEHGRERGRPRTAARREYGHRSTSGTCASAATCRRSTSAPSSRWCSSCDPRTTRQGLRLCRRGGLGRGPVGVGMALVPGRTLTGRKK